MVSGAIRNSLQMQFILRPRDASISSFRICRAVSSEHCQVQNLSTTAHLKALTKELPTTTTIAAKTHKGRTFIHKLKRAIGDLLRADVGNEQRVGTTNIAAPPAMSTIGRPIKRITEAPPIMKTRDPTAKRNLINTTRTHQRKHGTTPPVLYLR